MNKEKVKSNVCQIKDCGRPTHKESKYCIFHASAEEKTEEEFKKALKEYVEEIKEGNKDYNFIDFLFIGNISFNEDLNINVFKNALFFGATFKGNVYFLDTSFEGDANFTRATFKGKTYFVGVTFKGNTDFIKTTFNGDVNFTGSIFNGDANFTSATFERFTYFTSATFEHNANFEEAIFKISTEFKGTTFKGDACFEDTTFMGHSTYFTNAIFKRVANFFVVKFKGNANFKEASFNKDAYFEEATFEGDTDFRLKYFIKILNFSKIKTSPGKKLFIRLNNRRGKISFKRAHLENTYLDIELVEDIFIDFTDTLLKNTKIEKSRIENHILQEKEKEFSKAKEIYLLLKNNFHSIGRYADEGWAFTKEKDMDRKSNCHFKTLHRWLWSCFLNMIYGYGERPCNVIKTAVAIIIIFALSFSFIGLGNPEIIELKGTAIHQNSGNIVDLVSKGLLKNNVIRNFPDSLYFSTITFTTLGYGDFRPLEGWGRILAGSEAFIGAFMMALFVYTFARRTGGR